MAYSIPYQNKTKILSSFVAMTPYQVFLNQVKSAIEPIRAATSNLTYIPPQLGGVEGQREVIQATAVLQLIEFEIK